MFFNKIKIISIYRLTGTGKTQQFLETDNSS